MDCQCVQMCVFFGIKRSVCRNKMKQMYKCFKRDLNDDSDEAHLAIHDSVPHIMRSKRN